jgi:hypothetical protein
MNAGGLAKPTHAIFDYIQRKKKDKANNQLAPGQENERLSMRVSG